jgi:hypothetical protein
MLRAAWTRGAHLLAAILLQLALNPPCSAASLTLPTTAIGMVRTGISFAKTPLTFAADLDAHETSSTIEVTLAADVLFDFDKSDLRAEAASTRHHPSQSARAYRNPRLHGCARKGRLQSTPVEQRAASVKTSLAGHEQLAATRLATSGPGAGDPVASFAVCCRLRAETRLAESPCLSSPRPCRPSSSLPTGHARHRLW